MKPPSLRSVGALALALAAAPAAPGVELGLPQTYRLRNGLKLVVQRRPARPLLGVALVAEAGSAFESRTSAGFGHLVADLWQRADFSGQARDLARRLDDDGALRAATHDATTVAMTASVPSEAWRSALELARAALHMRRVPEAALAEARTRVLRHLEQKARFPRAYGLLGDQMRSLVYGADHPHGLPPDGLAEAVRQAQSAGLERYLAGRLHPNRATVVLVGDAPSEDALLEAAMELFDAPAGPSTRIRWGSRPGEGATRELRAPADVPNAMGQVGFLLEGASPDELDAAELLIQRVAGGPGSLLHEQLVRRQGVLTKLAPRVWRRDDELLVAFEMVAAGDRLEEPARQVVQALARVARRGVGAADLEDARVGAKAAHALDGQQLRSQALRLGRAGLAGRLEDEVDYAHRMDQVRAEGLQDLAARYFRPDQAYLVELYPQGAAREEGAERQVRAYRGGLRAVFEPDGSSQAIGLSLIFRAESGPESPGLAALLQEYLGESGTTREPLHVTERRLQRAGASLQGQGNGLRYAGLGLEATVYGFDELLQTLHDVCVHPRWDQARFERVRKRMVERWRRSLDNPEDLAFWSIQERLFADDPSFPTEERLVQALEGFTLDQLRTFHSDRLAEGAMVVAITGDLTSSRVFSRVEQVFGVSPAKGGEGDAPEGRAAPSSATTPGAGGGAPRRVEVVRQRSGRPYETVWVGVRLPGEAVVDLAALTVWFNLLGFKEDSLLQAAIRKQDPSFEVLWHSISVPPEGGSMIFGFRVKAGSGSAIGQAARAILEGLPSHQLSPERIQQASRRIRTALLIRSQGRLQQVGRMASSLASSNQVDVETKLIADYAQLDVEAARSVARRYLGGGVVMVFGPDQE